MTTGTSTPLSNGFDAAVLGDVGQTLLVNWAKAALTDAQAFLSAGYSPAVIDALRNINVDELAKLRAADLFEVRVKEDRVGTVLAQRAKAESAANDLYYLVSHGAPSDLIERLFGLRPHQLARYRSKLRITARPGRCRRPDAQTRAAIREAYVSICAAERDTRQRWIKLHKQFEGEKYSIQQLRDAVINTATAVEA